MCARVGARGCRFGPICQRVPGAHREVASALRQDPAGWYVGRVVGSNGRAAYPRISKSTIERVKMSPGARANPAAQSASRAALSHVRPCGRGPPSFTLEHKRLALRLRRREVFEGCPSRCPRGGVPWIRRAESGRLDPPLTTPEMAAMLSPKCAAQEASRREPYAPCGLRRR